VVLGSVAARTSASALDFTTEMYRGIITIFVNLRLSLVLN
jgi:hypothetical protein